jgi:hypothetical protein
MQSRARRTLGAIYGLRLQRGAAVGSLSALDCSCLSGHGRNQQCGGPKAEPARMREHRGAHGRPRESMRESSASRWSKWSLTAGAKAATRNHVVDASFSTQFALESGKELAIVSVLVREQSRFSKSTNGA